MIWPSRALMESSRFWAVECLVPCPSPAESVNSRICWLSPRICWFSPEEESTVTYREDVSERKNSREP